MPDEKSLVVVPTAARQAHTRVIRTRPVTFVCVECEREVTEDLFPGPPPLYCNNCLREVRRRQNAARQKAWRERQQARKNNGR